MAKHRCLNRELLCEEKFCDLSFDTRLLYIYLVMEADDDGFVQNPSGIARFIGVDKACCEKLYDNEYLIKFENGLAVIKHWLVHNSIRKDRYVPTRHKIEFDKLVVNVDKSYSLKNKIIDEIMLNDDYDI